MPKVDWSPGLGRHGRPIRRVLGVNQRQGLTLLYVWAGVMVLFGGYAALGGFASPPAAGPSANVGNRNVAQHSYGSFSPGGTVSSVPADPAAASTILKAATKHYADMFAAGVKIVGHTRYAGEQALSQASASRSSPAAELIAYRTTPNPEGDVSYVQAFAKAVAAYGTGARPAALGAWYTDIGKVQHDLAAWVDTAVQYQVSAVDQGALDAAAAKVAADLSAATTDAAKAAG